MAKPKTFVRCSSCGHPEPRWVGRCPGCASWGTMEQQAALAAPAGPRAGAPGAAAVPLRDVDVERHERARTGLSELDRVLGGGLVPGSVVLLGGEPGAGKSTLLLQACAALAASGTVLYVTAEESCAQVRLRAERLGALDAGMLVAAERDLPALLGLVAEHRPAVLVVDSVQTISSPETSGAAGGVAQVRECTAALVAEAKRHAMATLLVGHVTKDGQLAGPRVLEHLVDTVVEMEGDRHHTLRLLRATKNRFGPAGEVGCFEMTDAGLVAVPDAGRLFVGDAADGTPGVAVTLALEGRRPLACEVQALVSDHDTTNPRRVASGLDAQRLPLLAAVLSQRTALSVGSRDVFASTVGGVRVAEPAVDLALCLAMASSRSGRPVPRQLVVVGEVGLAGEVRQVGGIGRRLSEASRLGFQGAVVAAAYDGPAHGLRLVRVRDLLGALRAGLA